MNWIDKSPSGFHLQRVKVTASALIGCYLILSFAAVMCSYAHGTHQHETASHSVLCAWACQAKPSVSLISLEPLTSPFVLVFFTVPFIAFNFLLPLRLAKRSRAPPR